MTVLFILIGVVGAVVVVASMDIKAPKAATGALALVGVAICIFGFISAISGVHLGSRAPRNQNPRAGFVYTLSGAAVKQCDGPNLVYISRINGSVSTVANSPECVTA